MLSIIKNKIFCYRVQKILKLRLFNKDDKKWHSNVVDMNYEILSISQFTLCYKLKGTKLDFHNAMPGNLARENYQYFLDTLRKHYSESKVKGKDIIITIRKFTLSFMGNEVLIFFH